MKHYILRAIRFYQKFLSQPGYCRFVPSCSEYAYQAIERYGIISGSWFGVKRILRCHPWSAGGHDPVPTHI